MHPEPVVQAKVEQVSAALHVLKEAVTAIDEQLKPIHVRRQLLELIGTFEASLVRVVAHELEINAEFCDYFLRQLTQVVHLATPTPGSGRTMGPPAAADMLLKLMRSSHLFFSQWTSDANRQGIEAIFALCEEASDAHFEEMLNFEVGDLSRFSQSLPPGGDARKRIMAGLRRGFDVNVLDLLCTSYTGPHSFLTYLQGAGLRKSLELQPEQLQHDAAAALTEYHSRLELAASLSLALLHELLEAGTTMPLSDLLYRCCSAAAHGFRRLRPDDDANTRRQLIGAVVTSCGRTKVVQPRTTRSRIADTVPELDWRGVLFKVCDEMGLMPDSDLQMINEFETKLRSEVETMVGEQAHRLPSQLLPVARNMVQLCCVESHVMVSVLAQLLVNLALQRNACFLPVKYKCIVVFLEPWLRCWPNYDYFLEVITVIAGVSALFADSLRSARGSKRFRLDTSLRTAVAEHARFKASDAFNVAIKKLRRCSVADNAGGVDALLPLSSAGAVAASLLPPPRSADSAGVASAPPPTGAAPLSSPQASRRGHVPVASSATSSTGAAPPPTGTAAASTLPPPRSADSAGVASAPPPTGAAPLSSPQASRRGNVLAVAVAAASAPPPPPPPSAATGDDDDDEAEEEEDDDDDDDDLLRHDIERLISTVDSLPVSDLSAFLKRLRKAVPALRLKDDVVAVEHLRSLASSTISATATP